MKLPPSFKIIGIITLLLTISPAMVSAQEQNPETLLQAAINAEIVEGNLEKAIQLYEQILERFSSHRSVAARALLRLGQSHEKLGNQQAQEIYERLIRDYSDQGAIVIEARARLTVLMRITDTAISSAATQRQITGFFDPKYPDFVANADISNDGTFLAYADVEFGDLAIRDLTTGTTRFLINMRDRPEGEWAGESYSCQVSPDNQQIAYIWTNTDFIPELHVINVDGSQDKTLYTFNINEIVALYDWSKDGNFLLLKRWGMSGSELGGKYQIVLFDLNDRSETILNSLDRLSSVISFSPDGKYIAYGGPQSQDSNLHDIYVMTSEGDQETYLVNHASDDLLLGWSPDGDNIIFSSTRSGTETVWAIPISNGNAVGPAVQVLPSLASTWPLGFIDNGSFYYFMESGGFELVLGELDTRTGKLASQPTWISPVGATPVWSWDGNFFSYSPYSGVGGPSRRTIAKYSLESAEEEQFSLDITPQRAHGDNILWSPDGQSLLVYSEVNEITGWYRFDIQSHQSQLIIEDPLITRNLRDRQVSFPVYPRAIWSNTGDAIYLSHVQQSPRAYRIFRFDLQTKELHEIFESSNELTTISVSRDGRWLAARIYDRTEGERNRIYKATLIPTTGDEIRDLTIPRIGHRSQIAWTEDSQSLLVISTKSVKSLEEYSSQLWRIPIDGSDPTIVDLDLPTASDIRLHPDGRHIIFRSIVPYKTELWVLENILP